MTPVRIDTREIFNLFLESDDFLQSEELSLELVYTTESFEYSFRDISLPNLKRLKVTCLYSNVFSKEAYL